jgi:hypothetical protein
MKAEAGRRSIAGVASGMGAWLVPAGVCPACWPAYAGAASSLGVGFTLSAGFLVPAAGLLLALSLFALGYRARSRRGYGPLVLGIGGASAVLAGKLWFSSEALSYVALSAIVAAGVWNSWPARSAPTSCTGTCPVTEE